MLPCDERGKTIVVLVSTKVGDIMILDAWLPPMPPLKRLTSLELKEAFAALDVACAVASWLERLSPDRAVLVRALAGDTFLSKTLYFHSVSFHPGV